LRILRSPDAPPLGAPGTAEKESVGCGTFLSVPPFAGSVLVPLPGSHGENRQRDSQGSGGPPTGSGETLFLLD